MALSPDQQVTVVVAIVGGLVTVAGLLLSPWAHGRADRRNHMQSLRVDAYTDFLAVASLFSDNANTHAAIPLAKQTGPSAERVASIISRVNIIGTPELYSLANRFGTLATQFNADLMRTRVTYEAASPESITTRMSLGKLANSMSEVLKQMEAAMRVEMQH
ncbi:MAG: hypothetical protein QOE83_1975 [Actinomycetota bacterium]|jgi:hypothetical protein|nr:hypothetical protein [Actinomycetota bacterium]